MKYNKLIITTFLTLLACWSFAFANSNTSVRTYQNQVNHDDIINLVDSFIQNDDNYDSIPFRIYTKRLIDTVNADGEIEVRIIDRSRDKVLKSDNLQITIFSDGRTLRRLDLKSYIGIEVPIAVSSRDLKRGESVDGAYEIEWRDLSNSQARTPVYENDDISGKVVKVTIRAGRDIDESILEMPDLVKRGDQITVVVIYNGLKLNMTAKALKSGKLGETISALNESTGKTITCVVSGDGTAYVN